MIWSRALGPHWSDRNQCRPKVSRSSSPNSAASCGRPDVVLSVQNYLLIRTEYSHYRSSTPHMLYSSSLPKCVFSQNFDLVKMCVGQSDFGLKILGFKIGFEILGSHHLN